MEIKKYKDKWDEHQLYEEIEYHVKNHKAMYYIKITTVMSFQALLQGFSFAIFSLNLIAYKPLWNLYFQFYKINTHNLSNC